MKRTFALFFVLFLSLQGILKGQELTPAGLYENKGKISYCRFDVQENNIFWPLGKKGMVIFNAANPENLERVKYYHNYEIRSYQKIYGSANCVEMRGDTAYLANGELGLEILDFSNPVSPKLLGRYYRNQPVSEFKIFDNKAILGLEKNGAEVIDYSDPDNIEMVSRDNMGDFPVTDIETFDNYVYLLGGKKGLVIFSYKKPLVNFKNGRYVKTIYPPGKASQIVMNDKIGYLANGNKEIVIMDFNLPEHPAAKRFIELDAKSNDVILVDDYLYVATNRGIEIFLLQKDKQPVRINAFYDKKREYKRLAIEGKYLYASYNSKGLFAKKYGIRIFRIH